MLARRGRWRYLTVRGLRGQALANGLAATALLSLAIGLGVALWQVDAARQQRDAAIRAAQTSTAVARFLSRIVARTDADASEGRDPTASELLDAGAREIELATDLPPLQRSAIYYALGSMQLARGPSGQGVTLMQLALDQAGKDPLARFNALNGLAVAHSHDGQHALTEEIHAVAAEWLDEHPQMPAHHRDELEYLRALNLVSRDRGDEAGTMLTVLRKRIEARGETPGDGGIEATSMLVDLLVMRKDGEAALELPSRH